MNTLTYDQRELWGHPRGLYVLFATEMWERFSYYGMRGLLILYLTKHFLLDDGTASLTTHGFAALVYGLPVLGGLLADRFLGARKAIVYGGILLVLGHASMAFEGDPATRLADGTILRSEAALNTLFLSLSLIAVGVGFLKPNISTIVGSLYPEGDSRRDQGFTIFYMGINLGSFLAFLIVGYIGETYGWKYGFGLAGIGMLIGLTIFLRGQHYFGEAGGPPNPKQLTERLYGVSRENWVYLSGIAMVIAGFFLVSRPVVVNNALLVIVVAVYAYLIHMVTKLPKAERDRMIVVMVLTAVSVFFWALFDQASSSLNLFTDRVVDRQGVTTTAFQGINPFFIILLAPLFAQGWLWLGKRGQEPSLTVKFAMGLLLAGAGFLVLVFGIGLSEGQAKVAMMWLVLAYLLHTMGELCLSPVGLSMVTKLSVQRVVGLMMGTWFLATSFAQTVAGLLAKLAAVPNGGEAASISQMKGIYTTAFEVSGWIGVGAGVLLLLLSKLLSKMSGESVVAYDK